MSKKIKISLLCYLLVGIILCSLFRGLHFTQQIHQNVDFAIKELRYIDSLKIPHWGLRNEFSDKTNRFISTSAFKLVNGTYHHSKQGYDIFQFPGILKEKKDQRFLNIYVPRPKDYSDLSFVPPIIVSENDSKLIGASPALMVITQSDPVFLLKHIPEKLEYMKQEIMKQLSENLIEQPLVVALAFHPGNSSIFTIENGGISDPIEIETQAGLKYIVRNFDSHRKKINRAFAGYLYSVPLDILTYPLHIDIWLYLILCSTGNCE